MTDLQIVGFYVLSHYQQVIIIKRRPDRCFRIVLLVLIRAPVTSALCSMSVHRARVKNQTESFLEEITKGRLFEPLLPE